MVSAIRRLVGVAFACSLVAAGSAFVYAPAPVQAQEACICCTGCSDDDGDGTVECDECHQIECGSTCSKPELQPVT